MTQMREAIYQCADDPVAWLAYRDELEEAGEDYRQPTTRITLPGGLAMTLALIPPGKFLMGSPESEAGRDTDERQHEVEIARAFYLSVYPVTQAQWRAVMGSNPGHFKGDTLPVETVSWDDCQEFCKQLGAKTGKLFRKYTFRLPFESEWEYACRAGTTTAYAFGDTLSTAQANFNSDRTTPVRKYPANPWGLYDMHGNVWEWCQDWYGENYEGGAEVEASATFPGLAPGVSGRQLVQLRSALPVGVPLAPELQSRFPGCPDNLTSRVLRGGSWLGRPRRCRAAFRYWIAPVYRFDYFGCRVVLCLD